MRIHQWVLLITAGVIIAGASCSSNKSARERAAMIDSLKYTYVKIQDSIDHTWTVMIKDDDEKIAYLKRLLQEVSYTNNYDEEQYEELMNRVEKLKTLRYKRSSMENSNLIDEYDLAVKSTINDVVGFAKSNPEYEKYPLMEELITDIRSKDNEVLMYRVDYDQSARSYNRFINEHKKLMDEIDPEHKEKLPLFAIE